MNKKLVNEVKALVSVYMPLMVGGSWECRISVKPEREMDTVLGRPAMMSTITSQGERILTVEVNQDVNWQVNNLERTVAHEIEHVVCELLGFGAAMRAVAREHPQAALAQLMGELFEEVLDRFARTIVDIRRGADAGEDD